MGRLRGALKQKERRLKIIERFKKQGIKKLNNLTKREWLIAGIALYWGEGARKSHEVKFCNSDYKLIKFMINWLTINSRVKTKDLTCCLGINEDHRSREQIVKKYWSEITGIPLEQFRKTSFKKVKNKKVYQNFNEHYGTLTVIVRGPANFHYRILGLIDGLAEAGSGLVSRGVS
ncbi:hypothetical protein HZB97_03480 [Candidatus Gottesmanbacteria bacterium]|nr:hypothetical protein [Candidatus Gottesmanbacteria bacterium]